MSTCILSLMRRLKQNDMDLVIQFGDDLIPLNKVTNTYGHGNNNSLLGRGDVDGSIRFRETFNFYSTANIEVRRSEQHQSNGQMESRVST